jgi:hypothetical protein
VKELSDDSAPFQAISASDLPFSHAAPLLQRNRLVNISHFHEKIFSSPFRGLYTRIR